MIQQELRVEIQVIFKTFSLQSFYSLTSYNDFTFYDDYDASLNRTVSQLGDRLDVLVRKTGIRTFQQYPIQALTKFYGPSLAWALNQVLVNR